MILLLNLIGVSCGADDYEATTTWIIEVANRLPYFISAIIEPQGREEYSLEIIPAGRVVSARISVFESSSEIASDGIREISIFTEDEDSEEPILWMVLRGQELDNHVIYRENAIFDFLEGNEHLIKFRLEINETHKGIGLPEE